MNSNMEKPYVVGIDIGGTNTVFGIVDARGTIIASSSIKTSGYPTVEEYADEVCKSLLPLIIANGGVDKIRGIGIGAPNGNYYTGTIEFAPNLPWKGILPLAAMFEERLGIPTALTNDANAAAIGEMTYGAARGMKDFIMITLGTGVGSGIVINGQMVYGHDGFAGASGSVGNGYPGARGEVKCDGTRSDLPWRWLSGLRVCTCRMHAGTICIRTGTHEPSACVSGCKPWHRIFQTGKTGACR